MGFVGERTDEVQWQLRAMGEVFNFSRGLSMQGASGSKHVFLLELQVQSMGPSSYRPRPMRLLHCTSVHPDFVEVAYTARHWQGPGPRPRDE